MRPDDGAIDHRVFVVGILCQGFEHALPDPGRTPAGVAQMDDSEIAETFGEIPPRNTRPIAIQHRLDEQTIVSGGHPHVAGSAREKILDTFPLIISQCLASAHRSLVLLKPD